MIREYRQLLEISPNWVETAEGFLIVPAIIAKKTVLDYPAEGTKEFMGDGIFEEPFLKSVEACPVTYEHPREGGVPVAVNPQNYDRHIIGVVFDVTPERTKGQVTAKLKIFDIDVIRALRAGILRQLSQGYTCELLDKAGVYDGVRYDYEQTNFIVNHIAIVRTGRAGKLVTITNSEENMVKRKNTNYEEEKENVSDIPFISTKSAEEKQNRKNQISNPQPDEEKMNQDDKFEEIENRLNTLANVVGRIAEKIGLTEEKQNQDGKYDEEERENEDEEERENRRNRRNAATRRTKRLNAKDIQKIITQELNDRQTAFYHAQTLLGKRANDIYRENSSTANFIRQVLVESGVAKNMVYRMNSEELRAWLAAKADAHKNMAFLAARQNSYDDNDSHYGDKLALSHKDF